MTDLATNRRFLTGVSGWAGRESPLQMNNACGQASRSFPRSKQVHPPDQVVTEPGQKLVKYVTDCSRHWPKVLHGLRTAVAQSNWSIGPPLSSTASCRRILRRSGVPIAASEPARCYAREIGISGKRSLTRLATWFSVLVLAFGSALHWELAGFRKVQ
jgi:hypothetical protein